MLFLYNLIIHIYALLIRVASPFNARAKLFLSERVGNLSSLSSWRNMQSDDVVWVHCASHGEYEQALPLLEQIRTKRPALKIALTFFSPSGYRAVAKKAPVDWVGYIPLDTKDCIRKFVSELQPSMVIFVKNEWWWNALTFVLALKIPTHIISSTVRSDHYFIKLRMKFINKVMKSITSIGTVDDLSQEILKAAHPETNTYRSGDLRIDRVEQISAGGVDHWLEGLLSSTNCIVYGSVWETDVPLVKEMIKKYPDHKHIVFPHKLDHQNVAVLSEKLNSDLLLTASDLANYNVLHVDKMGLLSQAYRFATLAYVGGGYGEGIHNILEASVYGIPVVIGPKYSKSREAAQLIQIGTVLSIDFNSTSDLLPDISDADLLQQSRMLNLEYFNSSRGATVITYNHIFGESPNK